MTFRVNFFAEQAYLDFVKETLANPIADSYKEIERGAVCIIATACALESIVNLLLKDYTSLRHFDDLRFRSKIETLLDLGNLPIEWDKPPLQHTAELLRLRNWLVHFKDNDIGLSNSAGEWVFDGVKTFPKYNPEKQLIFANVEKLYRSVLQVGLLLSKGVNAEDVFEYLKTEDYSGFLVG
jgi:hypothetical protein